MGKSRQPDADVSMTLPERLSFLFDTIRPTDDELIAFGEPIPNADQPRRRFTNREIADKINSAGGVTITAQYIGEIRRGVTTDPRVSHAKALAAAFGVHPAFLIDDGVAQKVQKEMQILLELKKLGVRQVALRTVLRDTGLAEESVSLIEHLVTQLSNRVQDGPT